MSNLLNLPSAKGKRNVPPLVCHTCTRRAEYKADAGRLRATGASQKRTVGGRQLTHHELVCYHGHKWWSRHPQAKSLDRTREKSQRDTARRHQRSEATL